MTACWSFNQQALWTGRLGRCCAEQKASDGLVLLMNMVDRQQRSNPPCSLEAGLARKLQMSLNWHSRSPQYNSVQMRPQQPHTEA